MKKRKLLVENKELTEKITIEAMKKEIITKLKKSNDNKLITTLFYQIYDEVFNKTIQHYIVDKNLTKVTAVDRIIMSVISANSDDFSLSKSFIENIGVDMINTNKLLNGKINNLADLLNPKYKSILEPLLYRTIELKRSGGDEGPGEVALEVMSKNITKANIGDLIIGNVEVEVKSTQARLISASYHYGDVNGGLSELGDYLQQLGFQNPSKTFGFKEGVINELNKFIKTQNKSNQMKISNKIKAFFKNVYNNYGEIFWKEIYKNNQIDVKNWKVAFHGMIFDLYKDADKFNGILFINKKSLNSVYIEDSKKLKQNKNIFTMNWGPDYGLRIPSGVPQLWLKK